MLRYFSILVVLLFVGCSSYHSVTQTETGSYVLLSGNIKDTELMLDEQPAILVSQQKAFKIDGKSVVKFSVAKGTHTVKINKHGQTIVNRKIFVSEGNTFEVMVP